jgi:ABC-type multidrug transport system fused ATPase/permease subunit
MLACSGAVQLEDVRFHYQMRPDKPVLRGVTLSLEPGSVCALVGRSGSGAAAAPRPQCVSLTIAAL